MINGIKKYRYLYQQLPNNEKLAYIVNNTKNNSLPLIILHGMFGRASLFTEILLEAEKKNIKAYAIDLRGFGFSSYNSKTLAIEDFSKDLNYFVNSQKIEKINLLGWSLGGGIAMQFCAEFPEKIEKLILKHSISTTGLQVRNKDNSIAKTIPEILNSSYSNIKFSELFSVFFENEESLFTKYYDNYVEMNKFQRKEQGECFFQQRNFLECYYAMTNFNISNEYNEIKIGNNLASKIKAKTLIIYGENDYFTPVQAAEKINKNIKNSEIVKIKNCGHFSVWSNLNELMEIIFNFLNN